MSKPYWITVDGGDIFEGHQGHWADCFFANANLENILKYGKGDIVITEMTDEQLTKHPEAVKFQQYLIATYGTD